jgi:uncharacterized repeat protein (TIGR03803 family)
MRSEKKLSLGMAVVVAIVAITLVAASTPAAAQTETVLYSFLPSNSVDGFLPMAGLTADATGNLYGTTYDGGTNGTGAVFELSPQAGGGWSEKVLYSFGPNGGTDGILPTASVIFDGSGNLYGTTDYGGAQGGGIAFELTPQNDGSWTETAPQCLPDSSLMVPGICMAQPVGAGATPLAWLSSCHPRPAAAGGRPFCITSAAAVRMGKLHSSD